MKLLVVIPCCKADASRAELLLDLIYQLADRESYGACLLVFAPDVHAEMKEKLKIAAGLAFSHTSAFDVPTLPASEDRRLMANAMMTATVQHIPGVFTWPWLWLEPDCMPVKARWLQRIEEAYFNQPRRYLSRWLRADEITFIHRVGVYPNSVFRDIQIAAATEMPFEVSVVSKSTKCDLFQQLTVTSEADAEKIRPDAVLVHGDKAGVLADWVRSQTSPKVQDDILAVEGDLTAAPPLVVQAQPIADAQLPTNHKRRGRPPKVRLEPVNL